MMRSGTLYIIRDILKNEIFMEILDEDFVQGYLKIEDVKIFACLWSSNPRVFGTLTRNFRMF